MCAFAVMWTVIFLHIHPEDVQSPVPLREAAAEEEGEAGVLLR
jgi:hypothetical protein